MVKPSGLRASLTQGGISLDWDDIPDPNLGGFKVYASDISAADSGSFVGLGQTLASRYLDARPIAAGKTRFYRVAAFSKTNVFTDFTPVIVSAPAQPAE